MLQKRIFEKTHAVDFNGLSISSASDPSPSLPVFAALALLRASSKSSFASSSCSLASSAILLNSSSSKVYFVGNGAANPLGTHVVAVIIDILFLRLVSTGNTEFKIPILVFQLFWWLALSNLSAAPDKPCSGIILEFE